jgi:hypothetical protein
LNNDIDDQEDVNIKDNMEHRENVANDNDVDDNTNRDDDDLEDNNDYRARGRWCMFSTFIFVNESSNDARMVSGCSTVK